MKLRITPFLVGRICQLFVDGASFEEIDQTFRLPNGVAEAVYRRWQRRLRAGERK